MARRHSGIRCSRFAFVREAGMVQTPWFRSISVHAAPRASPERVAVSTRNSKASFTTGRAFDARTSCRSWRPQTPSSRRACKAYRGGPAWIAPTGTVR